jgi:hypothetical protein
MEFRSLGDPKPFRPIGAERVVVPLEDFVAIEAAVDSVQHDALTRLEASFLSSGERHVG